MQPTPTSTDTVTVPAGQTHRVTLGNGETLTNTLFDITADGASVVITAVANNWTIRNVGLRGEHPGEENVLKVGVPNANATGTVENLYLGDGFAPGSKGGIYAVSAKAHRGEVTFDRVHVAHSSNNGLYCSGPGHKGQPGLFHVRDSYFHSNNISNVRLGGPGGVSHVENTTVYVDDSVNGCRMNCSSPGAVNARGVWAWNGTVKLQDCDIQTNGHGNPLVRRNGATIDTTNCRIGDDADTSPPAAVPMSAEAAASGGDTPTQDPPAHTIIIDGDGTDTTYRLEVTGDRLEPSAADGATFNDVDDAIDGRVATGKVIGGTDAYAYDGDIKRLELDGPVARIERDGDDLDPAQFRTDTPDDDADDRDTTQPDTTPTDSDMTQAPDIQAPSNVVMEGDVYRMNAQRVVQDNWTVRNCAFLAEKGHQGGHSGGVNTLIAAVTSRNGVGVIENCVFKGAAGNQMLWLAKSQHKGTLVMRNCYVEAFGADALYADPPGKSGGGGGNVIVDSCVFVDNNICHIRPGGGSEIYNSVIYNTGSVPPNEMGQVNSRGLTTLYEQPAASSNEIHAYNCHVDVGSHNTNGSASAVANSTNDNTKWFLHDCEVRGPIRGDVVKDNVGNSPSRDHPDGVPTTAEQAINGGGGSGGGSGPSQPTHDHTLIVYGEDDLAEYTFTVSDADIEPAPSATRGATFDEEDAIDGQTVTGTVWGGVDAYKFNGDLQALSCDGPARFVLDGEDIDPADYGGSSGDDTTTLRVESQPAADRTYFQRYIIFADHIETGENNEPNDRVYDLPDGTQVGHGMMLTGGNVDEWQVRGLRHFDGGPRLTATYGEETLAEPSLAPDEEPGGQ